MSLRKLHTIIGLTLLIPFACWVITAMVFYIKPGYNQAYEFLQVKMYPLEGQFSAVGDTSWLEVRYKRTILGNHMFVRALDGWKHLDPITLQPKEKPSHDDIRKLLMDAFSANPARYGEVASISNDTIMTTTNILVILDWDNLSLQQRGPDTDRIDLLYRVHYLQWTGIKSVDMILGPIGLALVCVLSILGFRLASTSKKKTHQI